MADTSRREALLARSKTLRERATAFNDRLKDERAKEFMRSSVFNSLDDVDQFFLGHQKTRPSTEMWEPMWLDGADRILTIAEQSLARFEEQVKQFGGPEKVRMYRWPNGTPRRNACRGRSPESHGLLRNPAHRDRGIRSNVITSSIPS